MFELDRNLVKAWTSQKDNHLRTPIYIDVGCPSCGKTLGNCLLQFSQLYNQEIYHARVTCIPCGSLAHLFIVNWAGDADLEGTSARLFIDPSPQLNLGFPPGADFHTISPRFIKIYEQALRAKEMGYDELVGMGYRKALEFLLKDYLIESRPEDTAAIQHATLGACIKDFVTDQNLLKAAKHAAWLGNDETHYERRNAMSDINDLETLMHLTLYWIAMETMTRELA